MYLKVLDKILRERKDDLLLREKYSKQIIEEVKMKELKSELAVF